MIIKIADCQAEFFALIQLRKDVFTNEQNVNVNIEMDADDLTARHFVVLEENKVIATCRLVLNHPTAKLGRMAVAAENRHHSIGSQLLHFVEADCKTQGYTSIHLAAQTQAIDFYLSNGYQVTSDIFLDAGIPHKMMAKELR